MGFELTSWDVSALRPPFFLVWLSLGEEEEAGMRKDGEDGGPDDMVLSLRCTIDTLLRFQRVFPRSVISTISQFSVIFRSSPSSPFSADPSPV